MAVFLFDILFLIVFFFMADKKRLNEFFPVIISGVLLRFLEHIFVIDWFQIWKIHTNGMIHFWIPISADVTVWPVACYLFLQYLPANRRFLYAGLWTGIMFLYLMTLLKLGVFDMTKGWKPIHSVFVIYLYFSLILLIWKWLQPALKKQETKASS